eukprot:2667925-Rhodomonas_salina.2
MSAKSSIVYVRTGHRIANGSSVVYVSIGHRVANGSNITPVSGIAWHRCRARGLPCHSQPETGAGITRPQGECFNEYENPGNVRT